MIRAALPLLCAALLACASTPTTPLRPAAAPVAAIIEPDPGAGSLAEEARALRAAGDTAAAAAKLEEALAAGPETDTLRLELADLLVSEGRDLDRAAALLAEVRAREADVRFDLVSARLAELRGDDRLAQAAYGRALLLADDADVRVRRALALERAGLVAEARAELERVRSLRERDGFIRARLGELYEAEGRIADAEKELVAAAQASPDRPGSWTRLARFYERTGRPRAAREADARARALTGREDRALRPLLPSRR